MTAASLRVAANETLALPFLSPVDVTVVFDDFFIAGETFWLFLTADLSSCKPTGLGGPVGLRLASFTMIGFGGFL